MDTYRTVLFLHIVSLGIGIGAASILALCLFRLRKAETLADAAPWGAAAGTIEKAFPVAVIGLFATGAYLTNHLWTWSTGWIDVSIVGLAIVALQGPLVGGRAGHALKKALQENGPGPLGPTANLLRRHPALWVPEFANIGTVLGIVWNMTQKAGTAESITAVAVGYAAGTVFALLFARTPTTASSAAPRTAE